MSSLNDPSDYVLVLYTSKMCGFCDRLLNIWEDLTDIHKPTVTSLVRTKYPSIKIEHVSAPDNTGVFDYKKYPKGLRYYSKWFPMILLVPGQLWRELIKNLAANPPLEMATGVHVLNGVIKDKVLTHEGVYDLMSATEILKWIGEVVLKRTKEMGGGMRADSVTTTEELNTLLENTNIKNNPILKPVPKTSTPLVNNSNHADICSMRIIQRPK
jgi:hypothetical protein